MTITRNDTRFDYHKDIILKDLTDRLEQRKVEIEWLKLIKRVQKKDWTDFQSFLKNFDYPDSVGMGYDMLDYIKIWHNWEHVDIQRYTVDDEFVKKVAETNPERVVRSPCLRDRVFYTPSEFYDEIQFQIKWREESVEELETTLKNFDKTCDELFNKLEWVLSFISSIDSKAYYFKEIVAKTVEHFTKYK